MAADIFEPLTFLYKRILGFNVAFNKRGFLLHVHGSLSFKIKTFHIGGNVLKHRIFSGRGKMTHILRGRITLQLS